jgi:hypothetical protein
MKRFLKHLSFIKVFGICFLSFMYKCTWTRFNISATTVFLSIESFHWEIHINSLNAQDQIHKSAARANCDSRGW